jgi:hypothetical protein
MLPESFLACLALLEGCFTSPGYQRFVTLMTGWVLCIGKHTVTGVMRAAGVVGAREHSGYHRFFSRGAWVPEQVGLCLIRLALRLVPSLARVVLSLDDTLARHTGKHISSAGMHRDPLLSCSTRPFWHFSHNWIVLAVVVPFPKWGKVFSLPVLTRLYRTKKAAEALGQPHKKLTVLARELLDVVSKQFPERRFLVVADNNYMNRSVVRQLPDNVDFLGRGRMDAALYAPPPPYSGMGRPRVRGPRVASPRERTETQRWRRVEANVYSRTASLKVQVFDALWYIVGYQRKMRFVIIRGWPGHDKDDVLATTDLTISAPQAIELCCQRWSLEETFGWVKSSLGFEDPHNRTEHAVQRTAPMALWAYTLVVCWYAKWARRRKRLPFRQGPWYRKKNAPSFADMLATLRRQSWTLWVSDHPGLERLDQKDLDPLLDAVGYG